MMSGLGQISTSPGITVSESPPSVLPVCCVGCGCGRGDSQGRTSLLFLWFAGGFQIVGLNQTHARYSLAIVVRMRVIGLVCATATLLAVSVTADDAAATCTFCGAPSAGADPLFFDLSTLPGGTYRVTDVNSDIYYVASPCANAEPPPLVCCDPSTGVTRPATPAVEQAFGSCLELGALDAVGSVVHVAADGSGFNVSLPALPADKGTPEPYCNRSSVYQFVCDATAPLDNPPDSMLIQNPGCNYNVVWRHPAACPVKRPGQGKCTAAVPARPQPPAPANDTSCLPKWRPTWDMKRSTILYACNHSGYYDVAKAIRYGVVVFDWSSAEEVWANTKPMTSEEMLTTQAEMVMAADPGIPGEQQRVWVYRCVRARGALPWRRVCCESGVSRAVRCRIRLAVRL
jgi:hypothetical protein